MNTTEICLPCLSISGEQRISPAPFIHEGTYWIVDHAYPTTMKGWLVIVPRRHVYALHELSKEEFTELAEIQYKLAQVMHSYPHIQKEYMMCFAESEQFHHVHIHFVGKPHDLPAELLGPRIFAALQVDAQRAIPPEELSVLCADLKERYDAL